MCAQQMLGRNTLIKEPAPDPKPTNYNLLFPAFFALAHLAFAEAANLALPAADILRLGF
jgi:hypothetical protein